MKSNRDIIDFLKKPRTANWCSVEGSPYLDNQVWSDWYRDGSFIVRPSNPSRPIHAGNIKTNIDYKFFIICDERIAMCDEHGNPILPSIEIDQPVIDSQISKVKVAGTVLAAAAVAGMLFWGYRAASNFLAAEENNDEAKNIGENHEPTLFNSLGFGPE